MTWRIVAASIGVRCVPWQNVGVLLLLSAKEPSENFYLVWGSKESFPDHLHVLFSSFLQGGGDHHPLLEEFTFEWNIPNRCLSIDSRNVTNVTCDGPSATLMISLGEPIINDGDGDGDNGRGGLSSLLFHPVEEGQGQLFKMKLKENIKNHPIATGGIQSSTTTSGSNNSEDAIFGVFDAFSKISRFYYNSARTLLGAEDTTRRPRRVYQQDEPEAIMNNPWIIERELHLPLKSRRGQDKKSIPEDCPDAVFRMFIFSSGSDSKDSRVTNWIRLFKIDDDDKGEKAFDYEELVKRSKFELSRETLCRIDKDVFRTDRNTDYFYPDIGDLEGDLERPHLSYLRRMLQAYAVETPRIDYVQGMNDIASPILFTMEDEILAYKVFRAVMGRQGEYFIENGSHTKRQLETLLGMLQVADPVLHDRFAFTKDNSQLFICYRWLLLLFKREVGFAEFPLVLETIFSCPTSSYELFIALAILLYHRSELIKFGHRFDLTLQFFSENATKYQLEDILNLADRLHQHFTNTPSIRADPRFLYLTSTSK